MRIYFISYIIDADIVSYVEMESQERFKDSHAAISSSVGSLSPRTPGLLRRSLVASCGCLTGADALPALKSKIHSVVRLFTISCLLFLTPNPNLSPTLISKLIFSRRDR